MSTQFPWYVEKVLALLPIKKGDLAVNGLKYYIGSIRTGSKTNNVVRGEIDTVIVLDDYTNYVTGIRTYKRYPIFDYYFKEKTHKRYAVKNKEVSNIIEAFEIIYNYLNDRLPCFMIDINNHKHVVMLMTYPIAITYDLESEEGFIYESRDIRFTPSEPVSSEECTKYREEALFDYFGYMITVKEFLLGSYLLQYMFVLDNYLRLKEGVT